MDQIHTYNLYRYDIVMQMDNYFKSNQLKKTKELMSVFDKYANNKRIEYDYKLLSDFVIDLKAKLKIKE